MTYANQDAAREEIRKRQRAISHQVIEAGGSTGATIEQFNSALAAAGLPTVKDMAEWDVVDNGPVAMEPAFQAARALVKLETVKLYKTAPTWGQGTSTTPLAVHAEALGLTVNEVHAKARALVIAELHRRGASENDREAVLELYAERLDEMEEEFGA